MGLTIGVCGKEKNIGKTSFSLFLGQAFSEVTNLPSIVIDLDNVNPEIKQILEPDSINNYNIDNIMSYATVEGANLESVVKSNSTSFLNSKLNVIYGTNFREKKFTDIQMSNIIQGSKNQYDFTILDLGERLITQEILKNIDLILVMVPASEKYIVTLNKRKDYFNKKAEYVLNFNSRRLGLEKLFARTYKKEFISVLPFRKEVQININRGYLDFEDCSYREELYYLVSNILQKFEMSDKVSIQFLFADDIVSKINNNPIFNKIWGNKKTEKKTEERRVKSFKVRRCPMIGEILIKKGFITKGQLDEALREQEDA